MLINNFSYIIIISKNEGVQREREGEREKEREKKRERESNRELIESRESR